MAAGKANYIIVYKESAQVYSATSLATAVNTPLPKGCTEEGRMILFLSYLPDEENLCVYSLDEEQLRLREEAEKPKKKTKKEEVENVEESLEAVSSD